MKHLSTPGLLRAVCFLLMIALPGTAPPAFAEEFLPADAVSSLEAAMRESHVPGMAAAVVTRDGVVWEKWMGVCEDPNQRFLLGSLSKSFTAVCIMQLVEEGDLSLDTPISSLLPGAPSGISVRQLLHHTSGLGEHDTLSDYAVTGRAGEYVYANVNYALLGRIVEAVSGLSYEEYLRLHVLEPLGMHHTTASVGPAAEVGLAPVYENWFGLPVEVRPHWPGAEDWIPPAAGYISASLRDMERYLQMYLQDGDGVLHAESVRAMFEDNVHVEDEIPYWYGMGWKVVRDPLPETAYTHTGLVETGMTSMYILPESGLGIILMADMNDYLIGTDLLDRMGWNLVLDLMGDAGEGIFQGEYLRRHLLYDLLYGAVLIIAAVPLLAVRRLSTCPAAEVEGRVRRLWICAGCMGAFLLLVPICTGTPMWVMSAFVPDLHLVWWAAAALLIGGICADAFVVRRRSGSHSSPQ